MRELVSVLNGNIRLKVYILVLTQAGKDAFQDYLNKGGNFIGIHSATDCLNTTAFYEKEIGAYFDYHPVLQNAVSKLHSRRRSQEIETLWQTINVLDKSHPSTRSLPSQWRVRDEMCASTV